MNRLLVLAFGVLALYAAPDSQGLFEDHADIGTVLHPGTALFDGGSYTIKASGENMWGTGDAFHFVWKKFSGDAAFSADIAFPTKTGNPHKKAVLMIRQSLDADSAYVDAALHVEGLTSLQSRGEKGGATHEIGVASASPTRLRLEKRGDRFYMYMAKPGEEMHLSGGSLRLALKEPFYIGLGVCAHDKDAEETAVFSNVVIEQPAVGKPKLTSTLETISVSSTDRRVVGVFEKPITSPSWSADGASLIFKSGRRTQNIPTGDGPIAAAPSSGKIGPRTSPDGQQIAFLSADSTPGSTPKDLALNVRNLTDGNVKVLAKLKGTDKSLGPAPWSPDGKRLTFASLQSVP